MSFLVAGFGYVVEDHIVLAEFGADGCYALPEREAELEIEECAEQMFNLELQSAAATAEAEHPIDDTPDSVSSSSVKDIFDDFRINCKTVINTKLTKLLGTTIYMTTYNNYMDGHTVGIFTFAPPLISKTCYMKAHDLTAAVLFRPAHIADDDIYALGKCLRRSVLPASFVFHGLLDEM